MLFNRKQQKIIIKINFNHANHEIYGINGNRWIEAPKRGLGLLVRMNVSQSYAWELTFSLYLEK